MRTSLDEKIINQVYITLVVLTVGTFSFALTDLNNIRVTRHVPKKEHIIMKPNLLLILTDKNLGKLGTIKKNYLQKLLIFPGVSL